MQAIKSATATATEANTNQQNEKIIVNYFVRGIAYKISIDNEFKKYICHSENKELHILQEPIQCTEGHLSCKKCIVCIPPSNSDKQFRTACYLCLSEQKNPSNLPEQYLVYNDDACIGRIIDSIVVDCSAKLTYNLDENCNWKGDLKYLESHFMTACNIFPKVEIIQDKVSNIENKLKKMTTNMHMASIRDINRNVSLKNKVDAQGIVIEQIQQEVLVIKEFIASLELPSRTTRPYIPNISQNANKHVNGQLVWKIDHFNIKLKEARNGERTAIHSPPFYTEEFGYKLTTKIYLNGDGFTKGAFMSVFIQVMRGEYDAVLDWPFNKKIKYTLINQENSNNNVVYEYKTETDIESSSFKRPEVEFNIASGIPDFISHESLMSDGYIKDNTIFLKISVTE